MMKRHERGITLIALIVTIIILIILASITISNVMNANLFGLAKGTAQNYVEAEGKEQKETDKLISEITPSKPTDMTKLEIGQRVAYDPTVSDKNGTKITEGLSYTSYQGTGTTGGSGYLNPGEVDEEGKQTDIGQTFTVQDNLQWVILDKNEETGTVTLVSKTNIKGNFITQGAIGYLYIEEELHKICAIYGHGYGADTELVTLYTIGGPNDEKTKIMTGTGARSITIEDLNKLAKVGEAITEDGSVITTYKQLDSSYGTNNNPTTAVYYPTRETESGSSAELSNKTINKLLYTYYYYSKDLITNTNDIQTTLFNGDYWIASRCIHTRSNIAFFRAHNVWNGEVTVNYLCNGYSSNLSEDSYSSYGVRPIVVLKSNIIDTSKEYNVSTGWTLK